ncbi:hypothetical protein [Arachnia propionica]|uniref:Uncharacterized protein n=1 Tax=Arachnia propionica TaxID=1750 RepID=A0A3P1WSB9_9ACTN|nr:hypothetical protein [Arachnia propionica]RRD49454.1 hypothetical protein EII35_08275 [Arachnia propionica]
MREFKKVLRVDLQGISWYLGALVVVLLVLGVLGHFGAWEVVLTPTGAAVFAILFVHAIFTARRPGYPLGVFELLPVRPRTVLLAHYTVAVTLLILAMVMHVGLLLVLERLGHALPEHWVERAMLLSGIGLLFLGVALAFHCSVSSGRATWELWLPVGAISLILLVGSVFLRMVWGTSGMWGPLVAGVLGIIVSFLFSLPFVEKEAR